jgi:Phage integrase, N-terminal SAM-like domain
VSRESFGDFWHVYLAEKRRYLTPGSYEDFVSHGRKRLVPLMGTAKISAIDESLIRDWLGAMSELVEASELAPKTSARGVLGSGAGAQPVIATVGRTFPTAAR